MFFIFFFGFHISKFELVFETYPNRLIFCRRNDWRFHELMLLGNEISQLLPFLKARSIISDLTRNDEFYCGDPRIATAHRISASCFTNLQLPVICSRPRYADCKRGSDGFATTAHQREREHSSAAPVIQTFDRITNCDRETSCWKIIASKRNS